MNFAFTYSPLWLVLIAVFAALAAWWMYRSTQDLLPRWASWLLGFFRFLVLGLLAFLLLEPMLNTQVRAERLPIIAVLQDQTESLVVNRDSAFVREQYPALLTDFLSQFDEDKYVVEYFTFDQNLRADSPVDSLTFTATGSDLARAMDQVQRRYRNQNLGAIVLASDGVPTQGGNPLFVLDGFRQPVYSVLLGDTTPQRDVRITEVLFNEIAYLNSEMPIRVKVEGSGYESADLRVTLRANGKNIAQKPLRLEGGQAQGEVDFLVQPTEVGVQRYDISVSRLPEEISYRNNQRAIFVTVLETRVKIALFAGGPHPDIGALNEAFSREEQYELTSFIHQTPTSFYNDPSAFNLEDFDLFILHNFPLNGNDRALTQRIAELVEKEKKPVFAFIGRRTDLTAMLPLQPYLALAPQVPLQQAEEVQVDFQPAYRDHATYTFGDDWLTWANNAPPLFRNRSRWLAQRNADVYATARIKNVAVDYPVYALQNYLGRKNAVFLGEGIWRMRAHSLLEQNDFLYFDDWLFNNIKWLTVTDDRRKFRVNPSKRLFSGGNPIIFKGQVYDESYNPLEGVEIKLTVTDEEGRESEYLLNETGQGRYFLEIGNLQEGSYRYEAEGRKEEVKVGEDRGQFSVGRSNVEHLQLQADADLLRQIALRTGGSYLTARNLPTLPGDIRNDPNLKPTISYKKNRRDFHHFYAIMVLALLLLSVEWIVRKLNSLL